MDAPGIPEREHGLCKGCDVLLVVGGARDDDADQEEKRRVRDGSPGTDQLSYPKFEAACGSRTYQISMRHGLWDGSRYDDEFTVDSWASGIAGVDAGPYDALLVNDARVRGPEPQPAVLEAVRLAGQAVSVLEFDHGRRRTGGGGAEDGRELEIAEGRTLPGGELDRGSQVVVLGATVADELFGAEPALGRTVRVGDWRMRVIGVLEVRSDPGDHPLRVEEVRKLAALARRHYARSQELDDSLPEAYAMYGATFLLEGEEAERGLEPLQHAFLVALGLQAADKPGSGIR